MATEDKEKDISKSIAELTTQPSIQNSLHIKNSTDKTTLSTIEYQNSHPENFEETDDRDRSQISNILI